MPNAWESLTPAFLFADITQNGYAYVKFEAKERTMAAKKPAAKAQPNLVKQGAKFGLVGISNTVIDYTLFITINHILQVPIDRAFTVKFFSGSIAMINSFYWNRRWVFASRAHVGKSGLRFLLATLVSIWAIQPAMVYAFINTGGRGFGLFWFHIANTVVPGVFDEAYIVKTVAFGMGVIGSAIWNFTLYKLWAFKEQ
jgi:putative flippase GtrA